MNSTQKQIKVLMLLTNLKVENGVSSYVMNYFRKIDQNKIHIDFALFLDRNKSSPYKNEVENAGSKTFIMPSIKNIKKYIKLCKEIGMQNYDIVHDNSLSITIPLMVYFYFKKIPVRIIHCHNSKLGEKKWKEIFNKFCFSLLKKISTDYASCSKLAGNSIFGSKEYKIIPNVIDPDINKFDLNKRNEIRRLMNADDKFIIGTVGRIATQKNPFFAIDVFTEVLKNKPNAEYWWIGDGPLRKEVEEIIKQKKLVNKMKILGSRTDVSDLYQALDVFFLPSLFEGLPVTGIEAQAYGLPCILSENITREIEFTNLIKSISLNKDPIKWSEEIDKIYEDKNKYINRNKYNKYLKESPYSNENAGDFLLEYYHYLLDSR